jgi:hypothetical protein
MATTINNTMTKIQTVTVGSGGTSSIDFTSIPQTYTDLKLLLSLRGTASGGAYAHYAVLSFNGNTSNRSWRRIAGYGTNQKYSDNSSSVITMGSIPSSGVTSSTFSNFEWYIPNYASTSSYKTWSVDGVVENNSSTDWENFFMSQIWSDNSAISSISITLDSGNFAEFSTATLYGISSTPNTTKASGGMIYQDATYIYHAFPFSGTFTPSTSLTCDYLVVAGGGAGGPAYYGGGGGAGGLLSTVSATGGGGSLQSTISLSANTAYTVTVGAGGAGGTSSYTARGAAGSNSSIAGTGLTTITATGGGGGGTFSTSGQTAGGDGGSSGGGNGSPASAGGTRTASPVQGYTGGTGSNDGGATYAAGGGGGGAGGNGGNPSGSGAGGVGGAGGIGAAITAFATATNTGQIIAGTGYYAGGGGGGYGRDSGVAGGNPGSGGYGGGGSGSVNGYAGLSGTANTGGGGGGAGGYANANGSGGSGVVIIRYAK